MNITELKKGDIVIARTHGSSIERVKVRKMFDNGLVLVEPGYGKSFVIDPSQITKKL